MDLAEDSPDTNANIRERAIAVEELTVTWVNEKSSPELLQHKSNLVDCIMGHITFMEESLQTISKSDLKYTLHRVELDRIRYMLSSYLRTRLEKIEAFTEYLLKKDQSATERDKLMTQGEYLFAARFSHSVQKHFYEEAIKYLPTLLRDNEAVKSQMEVKPNLNSTVFIRMVTTIQGVMIFDEALELKAGSTHLVPYKDVKHLIASGSAFLI